MQTQELKATSELDRSEQRIDVHAPARGALTLRKDGVPQALPARLRNASASGASLLIDQALERGDKIHIELRTSDFTLDFMASVAWCAPVPRQDGGSSDGYAVGVQIWGAGSFVAMVQGGGLHSA